MKLFSNYVIFAGTVVVLVSFFSTFSNRRKEGLPSHLKYFYLYPALISFLSLVSVKNLFIKHSLQIGSLIEKMFSVLDLVFWAWFFYSMFKSKRIPSHKLVIVIFFLVLPPALIINKEEMLVYAGMSFMNLGKCLFCLTYFYHLFNSSPETILTKETEFWIITGLFFYTAVTIPMYISISYLLANDLREGSWLFIALANLAVIIMHVSFIKSQMSIKEKKSRNT